MPSAPTVETTTGLSGRETAPLVAIPTLTHPSYDQTVIGCYSLPDSATEEFRGIPYATVERRWQHSVLRTSLPQDVFDATNYGPRCPQPSAPNTTQAFQSHLDFPANVKESEWECLNLQISRPSSHSLVEAGLAELKGSLPVYIYIHGGALAFGASTDPIWDPTRLITHSVRIKRPLIVVSINYRLNIFGFLATDALSEGLGTARGCNFGLMDQCRAIEWVAANIHAFGGNPKEITIGGQSAGGTSVYIHALRALHNRMDRLFRACVMQSPAAGLCGPLSMTATNRQFDSLCEYLQLSHLPCELRVQRLRTLSSTDLLDAVSNLEWVVFGLVLDGITITSQMFDVELAYSVQEGPLDGDDGPRPLSVLVGLTEMEASIFHEQVHHIQTTRQLKALMDSHLSARCSEQLSRIYPFSGVDGMLSHDAIYLLLTDVMFGVPMQDSCEMLGRLGASVNSYYFRSGLPFPGPFFGKAIHCVDLIYVYDCFHEALQSVDDRGYGNNCSAHSVTHRALVNTAQTNIVHFITSPIRTHTNNILIYERDRHTVLVDAKNDSDTQARLQRYKLLRTYRPMVQVLCADILQLDVSKRHG